MTFKMQTSDLWPIKPGSNSKTYTTPDFKVVALGDNEASGEFFAILSFVDVDGKRRRLQVPRSDLDNRKALTRRLKNAGAYFSQQDSVDRKALDDMLVGVARAKRWTFAKSVGWRDGHRCFVTAHRIIGHCPSGIKIKPPAVPALAFCKTCGTLEGWRKRVARPASRSSRLVFAICAALAAPLLRLAELPSFGVLVFSPDAKVGKSTLLLVAGSVVGFGSEDDLPNFATTDAARPELFAGFNDMLLPINELGLLKGNASERNRRLCDFAYMLGEGSGTTYSKYAQSNMGAGRNEWRSIVLGSGEESSDEIAHKAGDVRKAGAAIRWLDLPATRGDAPDIFDRAPKSVTKEKRLEWCAAQCKSLRRHCQRDKGVASEHFLEYVIGRPKSIAQELRQLTIDFTTEMTVGETHSAVRHLAMSIGHIRAAGIIGVEFGTLPWTKEFVDRCVKRCYRDARRALRLEGDLTRDGVDRFCTKVASDVVAKLQGKDTVQASKLQKADGYLQRKANFDRVVIRGEAFKRWFEDRRQPALVLQWLKSRGALQINTKGQRPQHQSAVIHAETQTEWPNRTRPRSIVVHIPKSVRKTGRWPRQEQDRN